MSDGRAASRWEIERAVEEAEREGQEATVAQLWQREMAEPPPIGTVLTPAERSWRQELPELLTVKQTYANRTVRTGADSGEEFYLARDEYTGSWHLVCGMPTSARLPCRNSALNPRCQTNHVVGGPCAAINHGAEVMNGVAAAGPMGDKLGDNTCTDWHSSVDVSGATWGSSDLVLS